MGLRLKINFPARDRETAQQQRTLKRAAEAFQTRQADNTRTIPVKYRWVLDIGDPARIRRVNVADPEKYPDGVPSASLLKREGWTRGPKVMATRMPVKVDGNGHDAHFAFRDLYAMMPKDLMRTPANLYTAVKQPELRHLIEMRPSIWHRVQTGLYVTALIVLAAVIGIVIVVLLGE